MSFPGHDINKKDKDNDEDYLVMKCQPKVVAENQFFENMLTKQAS